MKLPIRLIYLFFAFTLMISNVSAQGRYETYEQLRDAAIKPRISQAQRSVNQNGDFNLDSAYSEKESKYTDMKMGVPLAQVELNHLDDILFNFGVSELGNGLPNLGRFLRCLGWRPHPCKCVTLSGTRLKTSLVRTYRWPVQKVETGFTTPYLGRYHTEEESKLNIALIKAMHEGASFTEVRFAKAEILLQRFFPNIPINLEMDQAAYNAAKAAKDLPDCPEAKWTIADTLSKNDSGSIDWSEHGPCRRTGHTAFQGTERANEYHLLPDRMRGLGRELEVPVIGKLLCHDVLDYNESTRWYSDFVLPNTLSYHYARNPFETMDAGAPFSTMMTKMIQNPMRCLGRNLDEATGLSPYSTPMSTLEKKVVSDEPEPCLPFNHGSIVPLTATAATRYDPVASAVGFYKAIKIAHAKMSGNFYDFTPGKDKVLWRSALEDMPQECVDLFRNYLPERGEYPAYGEGMREPVNNTGNVGFEWREFTCCHSKNAWPIPLWPGGCPEMNFQ